MRISAAFSCVCAPICGAVIAACGARSSLISAGAGAPLYSVASPARISIAPDGHLYALEIPAPFADVTPTIERWQLPATR